jgi:hypothetical protein
MDDRDHSRGLELIVVGRLIQHNCQEDKHRRPFLSWEGNRDNNPGRWSHRTCGERSEHDGLLRKWFQANCLSLRYTFKGATRPLLKP